MNTTGLDSKQVELLREAAEWRLISFLFECPAEGWKQQAASLAAETDDTVLKAAAQAAQEEASEGLYHSIFGPGGPAPAREVSYRDSAQPGYLLAELFSYYEAFSFHIETREAIDHISVETGFIGYLRLKQAYALAGSNAEHAETAAEAARSFIEEHLSAVAEPLASALSNSGVSYLALAASSLLRRVGPRRGKPAGKSLPVLSDLEESAFECGEV